MLVPRNFPQTSPTMLASLRDDGSDQSTWRGFFECYAPAIYRVARMRGLGDCDADDIVQQVMLAVAAHIGDFSYEAGRRRFRNWIRTIAERKIVDSHRRCGPELRDAEVLEAIEDPRTDLKAAWEQEWRLMDLMHCVDQAAADFSPRRMAAFRMYSLEGCSAEDVSKTLGMTIGSVYVTRCQVLNVVRQRMVELQDSRDRQ